MENWRETKAKLLGYGHSEAKIREDVIQPGNPEKLNPGHNWFPTKTIGFVTPPKRPPAESMNSTFSV